MSWRAYSPITSSISCPISVKGKNILLAAHGNTLRAMLIILGENTPENINGAEIATGVPLTFEFDGSKIKRKAA